MLSRYRSRFSRGGRGGRKFYGAGSRRRYQSRYTSRYRGRGRSRFLRPTARYKVGGYRY